MPGPHFVRIDAFTLSDEGRRISLRFVGAREFSRGDPCSADYSTVTAVVGGVLEVGLFPTERPVEPRPTCDAVGYGRSLEVELPGSFTGTSWRDLFGPFLHFLAAPPGLVEVPLPKDFELVGERDVEDSASGRWERTYATSADSPREQTIVLYQSFDGPVNVSGGTEQSRVTVNGQSATLYRFPPTGELVLVWHLGNNGLALVAYEPAFSKDVLIALAGSTRPSAPPSPTGIGTPGVATLSADPASIAQEVLRASTGATCFASRHGDLPEGALTFNGPIPTRGWVEQGHAYSGDVVAAAAAFDGTVVSLGAREAWVRRETYSEGWGSLRDGLPMVMMLAKATTAEGATVWVRTGDAVVARDAVDCTDP